MSRNVWENLTEYNWGLAERLNNDQGNQNLPEMRREDLFRRTGRALQQMCVEGGARQLRERICSRGR